LEPYPVELRCDPVSHKVLCDYPYAVPADESDWAAEYGDNTLAVRIVANQTEAMAHIRRYGTGHSECIVTQDYDAAQIFLRGIDAAAVYVNASTRFTDGGEFGYGAEIGISTQKLHARGPLGLRQLTSEKYLLYGNGQIRI
jgi:glutamate-5-semialdehyde dehydrogenase